MATAIVSVAALDDGRRWLSTALFALGWVLYLVLGARAARRHAVSIESFAPVAATSVLAARVGVAGLHREALWLWAVAIAGLAVTWLGLQTLGPRTAIRLLAVVATESVAVTAALTSPGLRWAALGLFATGLCLYPALITTLSPAELRGGGGEAWITMGALAISALAAASLAPTLPTLDLGDIALALWAAATAWLPLLVYTEARQRRFHYDPRRWATVFPLGMYAVASHAVGAAAHVRVLRLVSQLGLWVAVAVWVTVAAGALSALTRARVPWRRSELRRHRERRIRTTTRQQP
jgi:tellurite resistance protein TehA-like permease